MSITEADRKAAERIVAHIIKGVHDASMQENEVEVDIAQIISDAMKPEREAAKALKKALVRASEEIVVMGAYVGFDPDERTRNVIRGALKQYEEATK